jgi:hypothetical protein
MVSVVRIVWAFLLLTVDAVDGSDDSDRRLGAIVGSFVADAATMPLHWIYSTDKVKELVGQGNPEFFHTPSCPFYDYALGENTPYGQQTLAYLDAVKGETIDPVQMQKAYEALYAGGGRCYTTVSNATKCYKDASTKEFLKNVASGLVSGLALTFSKPLIARLSRITQSVVETIPRQTQSHICPLL